MSSGENGVVVTSRLGQIEPGLELPNLIDIQVQSYQHFLQVGLKELFETFSPIEDFTGNLSLEFLDYQLGEAKYSIEECRDRDITYELPIRAKVRLVVKETGEVKESEVYMGEVPYMTDKGTFLYNGAERVVVSQLSRSPGVYFRDTIDFSGRELVSAQLIPAEGQWVEFDTDPNDIIWVRIGQTRKFPVTTLLRAMNYFPDPLPETPVECGRDPEIFELFGTHHTIRRPQAEDVFDMVSVEEIRDPKGKPMVRPYGHIDEAAAKRIASLGLDRIEVIEVNRLVTFTMAQDPTHSEDEALLDIYRKLRPGDPPNRESAANLLHSMFFDQKRYDLDRVGRYKLNTKLGLELPERLRGLTKHDVIGIIRYILGLNERREDFDTDDIDHLENKRVRGVGELLLNQFRIGFLRMERVARERMTSLDPEKLTAQAIISIKPIQAVVRGFFGSGQLSQFMDEVNPLAELTHKRRLSALGPGGLSRQSAKLEVRDVHHSHYGRICPIETPEGPNIGLIGSLAIYAQLDPYGFIETPYRRVMRGKVTDDIAYLNAEQEKHYKIAPADVPLDVQQRFTEERVVVRQGSTFPRVEPKEIDFIDVAPRQLFSVATSLIPFIENDDPIRGLMGSNMQRQAVPLVIALAPVTCTGVEGAVARDSGAVIMSKADGRVEYADGKTIVVRQRNGNLDTYRLDKFLRTNQATCIDYKRRVHPGDRVRKGDVIADGSCTHKGELALGRDVLVGYMPWRGYNYEDAILISERLVRDDVLTSIHIEKYEIEARDTKLGPEEITRDIPNVGEDALRQLDENGIIRQGAEVVAEDILVGKVAPKGQAELTAEEKLVIAIFGKKAEEMRDVSLRMPHGEKGKVVGIRVFSRFKYVCGRCESVYHYGRPTERAFCEVCDGRLTREPGDELPPGVNQLVRAYVAQRRKIMVGDKLAGRHGNKGVISKILPTEDMPYLTDGTPLDVVFNPLGVPSRMNVGQILEAHMGMVADSLGGRFLCPPFKGFRKDEVYPYLDIVADLFEARAVKSIAESELRADFSLPECITREETTGWLAEAMDIPDLAKRTSARLEEMYRSFGEQFENLPDEERESVLQALALPEEVLKERKPHRIKTVVEALRRIGTRRAGVERPGGRHRIFDGPTGLPFDQPITVGYAYILKLIHLVEDKIHARSTGPYSLVTQQPLGGKAQFGGQRFGEMEVWALEAYGAAHALQEILTIKSDDVVGRVKTYESIVKGENIMEPGVPESFYILVKELESLALKVSVETVSGEELELTDADEESMGLR